MTTYNITINERTAFGRDLIQRLSAMPEIKFEKAALTESAGNEEMIARMKKAARNAKKIVASSPKTYSAKELMEIL
ncbi:MAG: hypothetical protein MJ000_01525 [Bacteroidales bacterium]|nr:hypothetical protein [Bacteroidales bacterium]